MASKTFSHGRYHVVADSNVGILSVKIGAMVETANTVFTLDSADVVKVSKLISDASNVFRMMKIAEGLPHTQDLPKYMKLLPTSAIIEIYEDCVLAEKADPTNWYESVSTTWGIANNDLQTFYEIFKNSPIWQE